MATLHANSVRGAINKLQLLPLLAGENIAQKFITPTIASSIDLVIQCSIDTHGIRRVAEISVVTGRCEDSIIELESVFKWNGKEYIKGLGNLDTLKSKRNRIN
jgi:pilus assembly protein CpaF